MIKKLFFLGIFILTSNLTSAQCKEVLVNGTYETKESSRGWKEVNSDDIVRIELSSKGGFKSFHSGTDAIQFSYKWSLQTQTIDLIASGYSAVELDAAPEITVSEWYIGAGDAANFLDKYYYKAELLDASETVIVSFEFGSQATPKICSNAWQQVSRLFTGYGTGLRKIRITHGGKDVENWVGHYGTIVDDSSVCIGNTTLSVH